MSASIWTKLLLLLCSITLFVSSESSQWEDIRLPELLQGTNFNKIFSLSQETTDPPAIEFSSDSMREVQLTSPSDTISERNKKYRDLLFQGDMAISQQFLQEIAQNGEKRRNRRQAYKSVLYPKNIWKDGVRYSFHWKMPKWKRRLILSAIHFWEQSTCINFIPTTVSKGKESSNHLLFTHADEGCWSTIGKDLYAKRQVVSIGMGCAMFGIVVHEIAHSLGIFHEQSRWDRNEYVRVDEQRVQQGQMFNFLKIPSGFLSTYNLPYDIGSVMHYSPSEFAVSSSLPPLLPIDPFDLSSMGQVEGATFKDVLLINTHYQCLDRCAVKINCLNGGYQNPRNCTICKCPLGFGGIHCDEVPNSQIPDCGGILESKEEIQELEFEFKNAKFGKNSKRSCTFHIKSSSNSSILLGLSLLENVHCEQGCSSKGMMIIKPKKDYRITGYKFCCPIEELNIILSETSLVPLIFSTRKEMLRAKIHFVEIKETQTEDTVKSIGNQITSFPEATNYTTTTSEGDGFVYTVRTENKMETVEQ